MQKRAIVVGSTSGIGRAVAVELLEQGYRVGVVGRREELLQSLKEAYPNDVETLILDVMDISSIAKSLNNLEERVGRVELYIHCSGRGIRNKELDLSQELITTETNVEGFTASINWAYKYFQKSGGGTIAAISSIAGLRGFALSPSYSASKSFQITYLEALAQKSIGEKSNIKVIDIRAGFVDTAMGNGEGAFWQCSAERAAKQIITSVHKGKEVIYVTKRWVLVAKLLKIIPGFWFRRLKFLATI